MGTRPSSCTWPAWMRTARHARWAEARQAGCMALRRAACNALHMRALAAPEAASAHRHMQCARSLIRAAQLTGRYTEAAAAVARMRALRAEQAARLRVALVAAQAAELAALQSAYGVVRRGAALCRRTRASRRHTVQAAGANASAVPRRPQLHERAGAQGPGCCAHTSSAQCHAPLPRRCVAPRRRG